MGNQLAAVAPAQIWPVEAYLSGNFEFNFQFDGNMGSTRFLKVARARTDEGLIVVKVFVRHDSTICLLLYQKNLEYIKTALSSAANCLPYQSFFVTDKAAFIVREYVRHSLYDRISTRPFLTVVEKQWITFQILYALHQCHRQKIFHGDIKLENILVTSWNWVLLTDFASFKPIQLEDDNPADYNYFFDTSRRRMCYIAPERFVNSSSDSDRNYNVSGNEDDQNVSVSLTSEMDIFSAGCVLLEMWTEGAVPFDYPQLLAYRNGSKDIVLQHLEKIENEDLRALISSMIDLEPKNRKNAEIYLSELRGSFFPQYFYTFLQSLMQIISSKSADEKIIFLYSDIENMLLQVNDINISENGIVLILCIVTSCIVGLIRYNSKLYALDIIRKIANKVSSIITLDRMLPCILYLTKDSFPKIRISALNTLSHCVNEVRDLPRKDINIFPEYILPSISHLADDKSVSVRIAYARNIINLTDTAIKFLKKAHMNFPDEITNQRYDAEVNDLHEALQQVIMSLLTDSQSIVKQTLVTSGIQNLCIFFGRQKSNDIILSHMITFLNDKEDKQLRGVFFDAIAEVAQFVGWHCAPILLPLLEQGLTDPEEFVVVKAIRATTRLIEKDLLKIHAFADYIKYCSCYLNHPNIWIRHEICGLISVAATKFSPLDVQCKIMPTIINHLKTPLIQVEKPEFIMDSLREPLPRSIFDTVLKYSDLNGFFDTIHNLNTEKCGGCDSLPHASLFRRLKTEGYNDLTEYQLLSMKKFMMKLQNYKFGSQERFLEGIIDLRKYENIRFEVSLENIAQSLQNPCNQIDPEENKFSKIENVVTKEPIAQSLTISCNLQDTTTLFEYSITDDKNALTNVSETKKALDELISRLKTHHKTNLKPSSSLSFLRLPASWKLKGQIIADVHEHRGAITKLLSLEPHSPYFISISLDNSIRLWNVNKMKGQNSVNRSKQMFKTDMELVSATICERGNLAVVAGKDKLCFLCFIPTSSNMVLQRSESIACEGIMRKPSIVDMVTLDQMSQNVFAYCNAYGTIFGYDVRMKEIAWRFENDLHRGVPTTMCADPTNSWLAIGTSSGWHVCWDLRYRLQIHGKNDTMRHPQKSRIRKITCPPFESSWLISASQKNNEVLTWNIETQSKHNAFIASSATAVSNNSLLNNSVTAMFAGDTGCDRFLLTGGTDQRIRYWSFNETKNCYLAVPSAADELSKPVISYKSFTKDQTRVTQEIETKIEKNVSRSDDGSRAIVDAPCIGHNDTITDIILCESEKQYFVASSSREGVIKLWK